MKAISPFPSRFEQELRENIVLQIFFLITNCAQRIFRPSYRPALQHSCSRYHFPRISKIVVDGLRGHPSHHYPLCSKMSKISRKTLSNFRNFYLSFWLTLNLIKSPRNKKDLNDVTAASFSVSFTQLPTAKKHQKRGSCDVIKVLLIL